MLLMNKTGGEIDSDANRVGVEGYSAVSRYCKLNIYRDVYLHIIHSKPGNLPSYKCLSYSFSMFNCPGLTRWWQPFYIDNII